MQYYYSSTIDRCCKEQKGHGCSSMYRVMTKTCWFALHQDCHTSCLANSGGVVLGHVLFLSFRLDGSASRPSVMCAWYSTIVDGLLRVLFTRKFLKHDYRTVTTRQAAPIVAPTCKEVFCDKAVCSKLLPYYTRTRISRKAHDLSPKRSQSSKHYLKRCGSCLE